MDKSVPREQNTTSGSRWGNVGCCQVTSGVPQGSVLGPSLFLVYINDLPNGIKSKVRLFADDTALYNKITNVEDCMALNEDLAKLQEWEGKWLMEFNVSKCNVLTVSNKRTPIAYDYKLHDQKLEHVTSARYLGVEITKNLKWTKHIENITSKANKTSAYISRNLKGCPVQTQALAYKTVVRPIIEYASVVWDPHLEKDIKSLEKVQKRTARKITNTFSRRASATALTKQIGLEPLKDRRKKNKILKFHQIFHNKSSIHLPKNITHISRQIRRHNAKLSIPSSRTDTHARSFFPDCVKMWNMLPAEAAETSCPDMFKRLVDVTYELN